MKIFLALILLSQLVIAEEVINVQYQDRRPEVLKGEDGRVTGPISDIAKSLFSVSNENAKFSLVPWARSLHVAKNGHDVFLIRHSMTDKRRKFLLPIIYGLEKRYVKFYKRKNFKLNIKTLEDLKRHSIGYRRKSFYFPKFTKKDGFSKVETGSDTQLIKMLLNERIDLIVFNQRKILEGHLSEMGLSFDKVFQEVGYTHTFLNPRYFSIPKRSKYSRLYDKLNCEMLNLRKSGLVTKAFKKYKLIAPRQIYSDRDTISQIASCKNLKK
ncbi:MAG: hypothetical protein BM556_16005 [Bacteriovorax sp. MedPE-SWde]|mgnify:CR=1 FL=1|nr:MAG: hypothetical protein BM556_16005 [Bacteriovorax sp. MedPE-SWde]